MHKSVILAVSVFALDGIIKERALKKLEPDKEKPAAGGIISLRLMFNRGAAMSRFENHPEAVRAVSVLTTAALALGYGLSLAFSGSGRLKYGLSMVLGGAASNVCDRCKKGFVVDYLKFPRAEKIFGRFAGGLVWNLSDFFIIAGALLAASAIDE